MQKLLTYLSLLALIVAGLHWQSCNSEVGDKVVISGIPNCIAFLNIVFTQKRGDLTVQMQDGIDIQNGTATFDNLASRLRNGNFDLSQEISVSVTATFRTPDCDEPKTKSGSIKVKSEGTTNIDYSDLD